MVETEEVEEEEGVLPRRGQDVDQWVFVNVTQDGFVHHDLPGGTFVKAGFFLMV